VGSEVVSVEHEEDAVTQQPVQYLTIGGDMTANVRFAIERDGVIVAASNDVVTFHADDVLGTPDEPFAINFNSDATSIDQFNADVDNGKWFTMSGIELPHRPTKYQKGVYIHNGKKVVIK
jgi:hypothetical protein